METANLYKGRIVTAEIGGSHISSVLFDPAAGCIVPHTMVRTELHSRGVASDILANWVGTLKAVLQNSAQPVAGIGIAMPGPFDYHSGISYIRGLHKYDTLYNLNIRNHFSRMLGIEPGLIRFRNDAEAAIAGEAQVGVGRGRQHVVGITLGTGFGSAIHIGNVTSDLDWATQPFKDSIADEHLSTRWLSRRYYELTGISLSAGVTELASIATNNRTARGIFREYAFNLGAFLTLHMSKLEPEFLILSGDIARAAPFFLPDLKKRLADLDIQVGSLGEHAALTGAAGLFFPYNYIVSHQFMTT